MCMGPDNKVGQHVPPNHPRVRVVCVCERIAMPLSSLSRVYGIAYVLFECHLIAFASSIDSVSVAHIHGDVRNGH